MVAVWEYWKLGLVFRVDAMKSCREACKELCRYDVEAAGAVSLHLQLSIIAIRRNDSPVVKRGIGTKLEFGVGFARR
jgi:hypothetical protein